ncbi:alpha-L-arabinofuranosidase C-terminal domain-containing protein [Microbacterium atlanticum]|uniref:alpha-L-arabinofuranosidase C-terminal domain-containing protein n=1 Tax=Microbacterium atlanticum TaxID=2782168 RepID=UPI001E59B519|nr:alpha-L-arabinofuranosidase C-terminal domain-containing protein [Microbacterium atlanticum]
MHELSHLAQGRAVRVPVEADGFRSEKLGEVAAVNAVATIDDEGVSLFLVNRSTTDATTLRVDLEPLMRSLGREIAIVESHLLHDDDLYAANTLEEPERVGVRAAEASVDGETLTVTLPAVSWAVRLS